MNMQIRNNTTIELSTVGEWGKSPNLTKIIQTVEGLGCVVVTRSDTLTEIETSESQLGMVLLCTMLMLAFGIKFQQYTAQPEGVATGFSTGALRDCVRDMLNANQVAHYVAIRKGTEEAFNTAVSRHSSHGDALDLADRTINTMRW